MFAKLAERVVWHRRWLAGVLVASALVAGIFATRLPFDFTPQTLFAGHGTLVQELEAFRKKFGRDDAVVLIVLEAPHSHGTDPPRDVLSPPALDWQQTVAQELKKVPGVASVESLATLQLLAVDFSGPTGLKPSPLIEAFPVDEATAEDVRSRLERMPAVEDTLVNRARTVAAVPVFLKPHVQHIDVVERVVNAIRDVLRKHPPPAGYRIHLGGLPTLRTQTIEELKADQAGLLPLGGVVYLLALVIMFRRVSGSLLPLAAVGTGLAWTLGLLSVAGLTLSVVSNVLPMLLLIIGISTCVQIVSMYSEEAAWQPGDRANATRLALTHAAKASFFATLTTLIGFASLTTARATVLQEFGLQAMLGVTLLWIAIVLVLGTFFPWFAAPKHGRRAGPMIRLAARIAYLCGHWVATHPRRCLALSVLAAAAGLVLGRNVQVNSNTVETYGSDHPVVQTLRLIEHELSGIMPLDVVLTADTPGKFLEPDLFRKVDGFQQRVVKIDGVLLARSYVDLHRPALDKLRQASRKDPDDATLRSRLSRNDKLFRQFPEVVHYRDFQTEDGKQARIMLRTRDLGTRKLLVVIHAIERDLAQTFTPGSGITVQLTGDGYVNSVAMDGLIRDLYRSLLTASFAIFGMIAWQFRSLRVGFIAALPNLTPLALTLGYIGLRGYDMNVGNVIVFTISLGFADDTTIHFLFRYRDELERHGHPLEAIDRTFAATGRAILQTSLLIIAGLSVLLFSDFLPTRRFGELTLVTLTGNLLGVLFTLPACLMLFWRATGHAGAALRPTTL